jgi:geranylgeranyl diphosphate synthase type II
MFDLTTYLKVKQEAVRGALEKLWDDQEPYPTLLVRAMRYSLEAGGKRLRPVLCIAASEAVGGSHGDVMPAACALELIHTYSLIHDDLPAMDDDDLRRGKATCHKAFDEATAILAGDALLTLAFETLAHAGRREQNRAVKWLEVAYLIARAAGCSGMVQGQMMDIYSEQRQITLEELETLHGLKTAALIEAAVRAGAVLGGGSAQQIASLGAYGRHIGLAFQMADDILNVEGTPEILGKPVGRDEALQKATGPCLMGLMGAKARTGALVEKALEELDMFSEKAEPLAAIARYVMERKR